MKYSTIKQVKEFCNDLFSVPYFREVINNIDSGLYDFEVDNVRFIKESEILEIMVDEIFSDEYTLGCFNADFIASNSSLNYELVAACQQAEAYEAIGRAMNDTMSQDEKEGFCSEYASADGYGHHFNHYDGNFEELTVNDELWIVFDNH